MNHIAILMTCFNRRENTIKCLNHLFINKNNIDVYLVDDKSNDGTAEAIQLQYPQVNLISGVGNLFWNRGMLRAWSEAEKNDYDFYIWLNDDVLLYKDAFDEMIDCSGLKKHQAVISGIVESEDRRTVLYGGTVGKTIIKPNGKMNPVQNLNGNFVLIPRCVFKKLGNLDPKYHHDLGDVDYGLRAKKEGIEVVTTRKAIGTGTKNDICRVRKNNVGIIKRFKRLYSPLGSHPGINFYFRKRHYGFINAFAFIAHLYVLNLLPDWVVSRIYGDKYN